MIDVIKGEGVAEGKKTPKNIALGADSYETIKEECERTLERLELWKDASLSTDYSA